MLIFKDFPDHEVELLKNAVGKLKIEGHAKFIRKASFGRDTSNLLSTHIGRKRYPDVIFVNGDTERVFEIITGIKTSPFLKASPAVVLGYKRDPKIILELYEQGANSFIEKPDTFGEMMRVSSVVLGYWRDMTQLPSVYLNE